MMSQKCALRPLHAGTEGTAVFAKITHYQEKSVLYCTKQDKVCVVPRGSSGLLPSTSVRVIKFNEYL